METRPNIEHTSKKGRPYKVLKVTRVIYSEKWIGKDLFYFWEVLIKYTDKTGGLMTLTYNHNDKLIGVKTI